MSRLWCCGLILGAGCWLVACGGVEIGEECDEVGNSDECVESAICTNEEGETARCRMLCDAQEDCPDGHDCNGVSNSSLKSCQPKQK